MLRNIPKPVLSDLSLGSKAAYVRASSTSRSIPAQDVAHTTAAAKSKNQESTNSDADTAIETNKKTMAQLDDEMKRAMESLAGDGGEAGVELEGGQPVAMKRSVRENMFRYI
jgi:hypothetical protein